MGLFKFKGYYKIFVKCINCGFSSEVRVPKGISVPDFVKGGKCKCDNCRVTFYPEEYTTEHFEKLKRKDTDIKLIKREVEMPKKAVNLPENIKW